MKRFSLIVLALCAMLSGLSAQNSREYIRNQISQWGECKNVAITKYNGDLALYGRNGWAGQGLPSGLSRALNEINNKRELIDDVQITDNGNWLVLVGDNGFQWEGIPYSLEKKLREFNKEGYTVTSVTFNDEGDWIVISKEYYSSSSTEIQQWLTEGKEKYGQIWTACITSDARVAVFEKGYKFYGNVPSSLKTALKETDMDVYRLKIAGTAWFFSDGEGHYRYNM